MVSAKVMLGLARAFLSHVPPSLPVETQSRALGACHSGMRDVRVQWAVEGHLLHFALQDLNYYIFADTSYNTSHKSLESTAELQT